MKTNLITFCIFVATLCFAQTQTEINNNAVQKYKIVDLKLNEVYQKILAINKSDTIFLRNLKKSQRLWVQFRDAQLKMKYQPSGEASYDKGVLPILRTSFLTELTNQRIKELQELADRPVLDKGKNIWNGVWYGSGDRESVLYIEEKDDKTYTLHFKGTRSEWEGLGYDFGARLIAIFRYKDNDERGYFTITLNSSKRAEFSSYNSDGSYRANGYLIKN